MNQPLFSIIIPVYNVAPYLKACLDSITVAVKRYGNGVELICIDDGSTDVSGAMLDGYDWQTELITPVILHQNNSGVSAARNRGLELAKGDYICFVDADDLVDENWLVWYERGIKHYGPDVVRIRRPWWDVKPGLIEESRALHTWCWNEFVKEGYPWAYAVRREIAIKEKFPLGVAMSEDSLYAAMLVPHIRKVFQMEENGYVHMMRDGSAMFKPLCSAERLMYLKTLLSLVDKNPKADKNRVSKMCADCILQWAWRCGDDDNSSEIRSIWLKLKSKGFIETAVVGRLFRLPYWIYAKIGWIWPIKFWSVAVRFLINVKEKTICGIKRCK